jgi:hypothetical protein
MYPSTPGFGRGRARDSGFNPESASGPITGASDDDPCRRRRVLRYTSSEFFAAYTVTRTRGDRDLNPFRRFRSVARPNRSSTFGNHDGPMRRRDIALHADFADNVLYRVVDPRMGDEIGNDADVTAMTRSFAVQ